MKTVADCGGCNAGGGGSVLVRNSGSALVFGGSAPVFGGRWDGMAQKVACEKGIERLIAGIGAPIHDIYSAVTGTSASDLDGDVVSWMQGVVKGILKTTAKVRPWKRQQRSQEESDELEDSNAETVDDANQENKAEERPKPTKKIKPTKTISSSSSMRFPLTYPLRPCGKTKKSM